MAKFSCNFISYVLRRTVDVTVIIPSPTIPESMSMTGDNQCRHTPKAKYPVLYLLHGVGNNHATWSGYTNVELFAEERNIAVVNFSAENKRYLPNGGDDFLRFVHEELPDFVCGNFPISDKPEDTYIAGLSMGGYGTLIHSLTFPERFAAFGAFSASVKQRSVGYINSPDFSDPQDFVPDPKYDPEKLAEKIAADGRKFPKVYMACGLRDAAYAPNVEMRDKLISLGADVTWDEIAEYGHEWRFWNIEIEKFLDWLPRNDYYAREGKRQI